MDTVEPLHTTATPLGPWAGSYSGIFSVCTQPLRLSSDGSLSVRRSPPPLGSLNSLGHPLGYCPRPSHGAVPSPRCILVTLVTAL